MTRRIAIAILLSVWAMLIASGVTAYVTAREVLLSDLDQTLVMQASALPELVPPVGGSTPAPMARAVGGVQFSTGIGAEGNDRYVIRAITDGRIIPAVLQEPAAPSDRPNGATALAPGTGVVSARFSTLADGTRVRAVTLNALARPQQAGAPPVSVLVTYSRAASGFDHLLDRLALTLALCSVGGGLFAAAIAHRVSKIALRPLLQTAQIVGTIDERNLDRRISAESLPVELQPVAARLNEMFTRLGEAFSRRRQFLGDAAHEMRTPVAALITGIEVTLARPRQGEAYRSSLERSLVDAKQLQKLVERLMEQVKSENFSHDEAAEMVDVSTLLDECCDTAAELGQHRNIVVHRDYSQGMAIKTQAGRLRTVISNLVSNAVEYNRDGGKVELTAHCNGQGLVLVVSDTGPGIAADKLPHVFEPFFRGDESRRSEAGHLGLGLFLVKTHLDALKGQCTVESEVGNGSRFRILVPVQVPAK